MNKEEINKKVLEYIREKDDAYALMIRGSWGCGKTYLYKHTLSDSIEKEIKKGHGKSIYISLYGMKRVEDLAKEVIFCFLTKDTKFEGSKKVVKSVDGFLSVVSKSVSFQISDAKLSFDGFYEWIKNTFGDLIKPSNSVICFDDLERTSIPINELFGFIDNLIEHCNCKVIILADEENIGRMYANTNIESKYLSILSGRRLESARIKSGAINIDSSATANLPITIEELKTLNEEVFSENFVYKDIKEKIIGDTVFYDPDIDEIFDNIISELEVSDYKDFLDKNKSFIKDQFKSLRKNINYRIVRAWIRMFKRIYDEFKKNYQGSPYYDEIMNSFVTYSIFCKYSHMMNNKIENEWLPDTYRMKVQRNPSDEIMAHRFIDDLVIYSSWSSDAFKNSAEELKEDIKRREESLKSLDKHMGKALYELRMWTDLDDEQIIEYTQKVVEELKDDKYDFGDFIEILGYLFLFEENGLFKGKIDDAVNEILDRIDKCPVKISLGGLGYDSSAIKDTEHFNEVCAPVYAKVKAHNAKLDEQDMKKYFDDADMFKDYYEENNIKFRSDGFFVGAFGVDNLIDLLKKTGRNGAYKLSECIDDYYRYIDIDGINSIYTRDLPYLKQLKDRLDKDKILDKGVTNRYAKDALINSIDDSIGKLSDGIKDED